MTTLFWLAIFFVFYAFLGYGLVIAILARMRPQPIAQHPTNPADYPSLTLIVPCFNEVDFIQQKIDNSLALSYPTEKLEIIFISDGSSDGTDHIIAAQSGLVAMHRPERLGKAAAMNRAVRVAKGEVVVFCDANTDLNSNALLEIAKHYSDPKIGAVAGEKRIAQGGAAAASEAGEGFYWKYESALKKWDARFYTIVGAAGELFSCRKSLYEELPQDSILDDFMLSMRIAEKGYRVVYEPAATATETASADVAEEMKRKIRIAAGGWQSVSRLKKAINPLHNFTLWFQYVSHRVLRWTVTPFLLVAIFVGNHFLLTEGAFYALLLAGQYLFYAMAFVGHLLSLRQIKIKVFFVPYYFVVMNYCALAGFLRFIRGQQKATWERSKRAPAA